MSSFGRTAYHFVLRLHPRGFRAEFGDEMLWIFDQEMRYGESGGTRVIRCMQLLADVVHSAFIQRLLRETDQPKILTAPFGHMNSSGSLIDAGQGVLFCLALVLSVLGIFLSGEMVMSVFRELFRLL